MGYCESSKSYRIYFLGFKNIDISRDITFDEDSCNVPDPPIDEEDATMALTIRETAP